MISAATVKGIDAVLRTWAAENGISREAVFVLLNRIAAVPGNTSFRGSLAALVAQIRDAKERP